MDTNELLTKAEKKLKEIITDFEGDKKQLAGLTIERGNLLALELIASSPEQKEKIKKLDKTITNLKMMVEDTPAIIDGLKKAKLKLLSQKEKEDKKEALKGQTKLETSLNSTSQKLVVLLKEVIKLNRELKTYWGDWDKLDTISGKNLTDKKCLRSSVEGIDKVCGTLISEWSGSSDGKTRKFYSKGRYQDTRLIF